mgnify:CR=1 FL=1
MEYYITSAAYLQEKSLFPVKYFTAMLMPEAIKVNAVTREQRRALVALLKGLRVRLRGFRPIEEAIVTRGGVNVREVNPKTMESRCLPGLYFAGEVLDVDAYTGGFNLQIAFSTAYSAAVNM